jgi:hypothetical protein
MRIGQEQRLVIFRDIIQRRGFFDNIPLYTDVDRYRNTLSKLKKTDVSFCYGAHNETIKRREYPVSVENTLGYVNRIESLSDEISNEEGRRRTIEQLVIEICHMLDVNYSIHAYWTVFAHVRGCYTRNNGCVDSSSGLRRVNCSSGS